MRVSAKQKRLNEKYAIVLGAVFIIPLIVVGILFLFTPKNEISESEQRTLAQYPELSKSNFWAGDYFSGITDFYADQFPGRDMLLSVNKWMNNFYYVSTDDGIVIIDGNHQQGMEGNDPSSSAPESSAPETSAPESSMPAASSTESSLPASSSEPESYAPIEVDKEVDATVSNGTIIINDRIMEQYGYSTKRLAEHAEIVNRVKELLPECRVFSLTAPTAVEWYSPTEYHSDNHSQYTTVQILRENLSEDVIQVNAYAKLREHVNEYLYFRSDHHWTQLGAYYAYTAFCESAGFEANRLSTYEHGFYEGFLGTLYNAARNYPQSDKVRDNPDTIQYYIPRSEHNGEIYVDSKYTVGYNIQAVKAGMKTGSYARVYCGDFALIKFSSDCGTGKKALITKDSFGNAFIPFLLDHYSEVYVVDPRHIPDVLPSFTMTSFVEEKGIDDIIIMNYAFATQSNGFLSKLDAIVK